MKKGTSRHPKMKKLARRLKITVPHAVGILEVLWHFTAEFYPAGDVGRADDADLGELLSWKNPEILIKALIDEGWLDEVAGPSRFIIHDWASHAEDSVHFKLARKRLYFSDGSTPKYNRFSGAERQSADEFYNRTSTTTSASHDMSMRVDPLQCGRGGEGYGVFSTVVDSTEKTTTPEVSQALVVTPSQETELHNPVLILDELKQLYAQAGVQVPGKHEQTILQYLLDIHPPVNRRRVPTYVKWALVTGKWPTPAKTKGLLSLLQSGDWDVDPTPRTLPQAEESTNMSPGRRATIEAMRQLREEREQNATDGK